MYATTAVQLTPFKPIDQFLLKIDLLLHFHAAKIMETLYNHPIFVKFFLYKAYNFLNYEVLLLPAFLIFFRYFNVLKEFIFYVLITLLIGYLIYYFFPTTAPASILYSPHFLPEQLNTGKKFYELHHYISPESGAGGLIAMPSFHVLWALICQQSTWHLKWLWLILLPLNILIILAALLLGWHYLADILGSACILGIAWRMEQVLIRVQTA
jgi:membrane-associated phospholipid phosphatase